MYRATTTFHTPTVSIDAGTILDDDHPLVRSHPDCFAAVEVRSDDELAWRRPGTKSAARRTDADPDSRPKPQASTADWTSYALSRGIEVPDGSKRADIIALVEHADAAGDGSQD